MAALLSEQTSLGIPESSGTWTDFLIPQWRENSLIWRLAYFRIGSALPNKGWLQIDVPEPSSLGRNMYGPPRRLSTSSGLDCLL